MFTEVNGKKVIFALKGMEIIFTDKYLFTAVCTTGLACIPQNDCKVSETFNISSTLACKAKEMSSELFFFRWISHHWKAGRTVAVRNRCSSMETSTSYYWGSWICACFSPRALRKCQKKPSKYSCLSKDGIEGKWKWNDTRWRFMDVLGNKLRQSQGGSQVWMLKREDQ